MSVSSRDGCCCGGDNSLAGCSEHALLISQRAASRCSRLLGKATRRMHSGHFWVSPQCREKQGGDGHTVTHVRALCRAIHSGSKLASCCCWGCCCCWAPGVPILLRRLRCRRGRAHACCSGSSELALGHRRHARRLGADPVSKSGTRVRAPSATRWCRAEQWFSNTRCLDGAQSQSMQEGANKSWCQGAAAHVFFCAVRLSMCPIGSHSRSHTSAVRMAVAA